MDHDPREFDLVCPVQPFLENPVIRKLSEVALKNIKSSTAPPFLSRPSMSSTGPDPTDMEVPQETPADDDAAAVHDETVPARKPEQTSDDPPAKKQKPQAKPRPAPNTNDVNTVRVAMAEMRKLREQKALSCDAVLSSGARVGEFLLDQWERKERRRK